MSDTKRPTAVDLFSGCGGISSGLRRAGFRMLAGVEIEPRFSKTFAANFPEAKTIDADLSKTDPADFMQSLHIKRGELDLLSGGPPCQGFSKNVPRRSRFLEDPKNQLVSTFLDYCQGLMPKTILMENVAEMRNGFDHSYTDEIIERLSSYGYSVTNSVLLAADYGVPQRRRRAFFLAVRKGASIYFPVPTHCGGKAHTLFGKRHVSVWDAISDLPPLEHGRGDDPCHYASAPKSPFQKIVRGSSRIVRNHVARALVLKQYERLASLEPGQGIKDLPPSLRPKSGYSGAYGRLTKEMIAPTITRWVFHPGSGRFGHPVDVRTITIREAARIQGFADDFVFTGSYNVQAAQVGNAVPPLLVEQIGHSIMSSIGHSSLGHAPESARAARPTA